MKIIKCPRGKTPCNSCKIMWKRIKYEWMKRGLRKASQKWRVEISGLQNKGLMMQRHLEELLQRKRSGDYFKIMDLDGKGFTKDFLMIIF